ncbi:hypothetical protein ABIA52_000659 [Paenarthrobacter histidinolovorans]|uniref:Uncharacterized protein n=1 Tax=Paenarthrobacter histidinolovorans TaxID=43664 RepID=A0ABW8N183_9MICC
MLLKGGYIPHVKQSLGMDDDFCVRTVRGTKNKAGVQTPAFGQDFNLQRPVSRDPFSKKRHS